MNNDDFSAPRGPQDLTELPEVMIRAKIQRQCARWRNFTLDPEWYDLVKWWVTVKKDKIPTWRVRWYWRDEYIVADARGEERLDYKAWFRAVVMGDQILAIEDLLDAALHARKRHEGSVEKGGPLESSNPYTITL